MKYRASQHQLSYDELFDKWMPRGINQVLFKSKMLSKNEYFCLTNTASDFFKQLGAKKYPLPTTNQYKTQLLCCFIFKNPFIELKQINQLSEYLKMDVGSLSLVAACTGRMDLFNQVLKGANKQDKVYLLDNYNIYLAAVSCGQNQVLKALFDETLKSKSFLRRALHVLPEEILTKIKFDNFALFNVAIAYGHKHVLETLVEIAPKLSKAMLSVDQYSAFHKAASEGYLDVVKMLIKLVPDSEKEILESNDFEALYQAIINNHTAVVHYLLEFPSCLKFVMRNPKYKEEILKPFIDSSLNALKVQITEKNNPHLSENQVERYALILMSLQEESPRTKKTQREIDFLLRIPVVKRQYESMGDPEVFHVLSAFNVNDTAAYRSLCEHKLEQAKQFFSKPSSDIKLSRDKSNTRDYSLYKIEGKYYMTTPKGENLGEGGFGKVKLAVLLDEKGKFNQFYAIKREHTNEPMQIRESKVSKEMGLSVADKVHRFSKTRKRTRSNGSMHNKYYTVQHYFGKSLSSLLETPSFSPEQRSKLAIQVALEVQNMHDRTPPLAHRDLKPDNLLVGKSGEVKIIDFGMTEENKPIDINAVCGTPHYLPGFKNYRKSRGFDREMLRKYVNLIKLDCFALKRCILQPLRGVSSFFSKQELDAVSPIYNACLQTEDEEAASKSKLSAKDIAAYMIAFEAQLPLERELVAEELASIVKLYQSNPQQFDIEQFIQEAEQHAWYGNPPALSSDWIDKQLGRPGLSSSSSGSSLSSAEEDAGKNHRFFKPAITPQETSAKPFKNPK